MDRSATPSRARRRITTVMVAIALVGLMVAVLLAIAWSVLLPHYRPSLHQGERYGIDVSHHQGAIDWHMVADDDISFAYIKASQGHDFIDPRFHENAQGATSSGVEWGAYHFFSFCSSGVSQARLFLRVLPTVGWRLPPAVDLELAGNCDRRPSEAWVRDNLMIFLDQVEEASESETVLYLREDFVSLYPFAGDLDRPRWVVRFLRRPPGSWRFWQVGGYAQVEGISGRVDLDVGRLEVGDR